MNNNPMGIESSLTAPPSHTTPTCLLIRPVSSRTRCLNRLMDFEWMRIFGLFRRLVTLNPRNGRHDNLFPVDFQPETVFNVTNEARTAFLRLFVKLIQHNVG